MRIAEVLLQTTHESCCFSKCDRPAEGEELPSYVETAEKLSGIHIVG